MPDQTNPSATQKDWGEFFSKDSAIKDRADAIQTVIKARRSTRRFSDTPISEADLLELVEAGVYAPSGSNWQNQRFLIITDSEEIELIGKTRFVWPYPKQARESNPAGIIGHASALIVVFAEAAKNDWRQQGEYHLWESLEIQNCAASIENMLLLATAKGIASCWVSASQKMSHTRLLSGQSWRSVFSKYDIPMTCKIQAIVLLGYPLAVDEGNFPKGEKRHGATVWESTDRRPVEEYLIPVRTAQPSESLGPWTRGRLKILSSILRFLLGIVARVDKSIEKTERRVIDPKL